MFLSKQDELSNAQVITTSAASTNQLDIGPAAYTGNSAGIPLGSIFCNVDTDFTAAGAATLQIGLRSSPNADMTGATVHLLGPPLPVSLLKRGTSLRQAGFQLPVPGNVNRYIDVFYTVATGPFTAGAMSARLALHQPNSVGS